jgi:hypothetical protein
MTNPTSNFGWQMPTPTDLVTDLPADFEVFGQSVDTSMADLKGGTTGQILSKATNTDMDFTWITNDIGDITAVTATTPLTGGGTSGAITVGIQDASTSQRGSVQLSDLTNHSSSTTAATPTAVNGVRYQLKMKAGAYYTTPGSTLNQSVTAPANTTYYFPIQIPTTTTIDRIAISTQSTFSGSSVVRLGIFNESNGEPGTVLLDAGTVACTAASTVYSITISQTLNPGLYFLAANTVTAASTNNYIAYVSTTGNNLMGNAFGSSFAGSRYTGYSQSVNVTSGFSTGSGSLSISAGIMTAIRVA